RQAVLAHAADLAVPHDQLTVLAADVRLGLRADAGEGEALSHPGPRRGLPGRHEAVAAAGGRAIGDAAELPDRAVGDALHLAGRRLGDLEDLAGAAAGCEARGRRSRRPGGLGPGR